MRELSHLNKHRIPHPLWGMMGDKHNGAFKIRRNGMNFTLIVSNGGGWEHVSISTSSRCPTWDEMCYFKSLFFEPHEVCIQYHPAESEYVNNHPFCLHIWRPVDTVIPTPPGIFVGLPQGVFDGLGEVIKK